MIIQTCPKCGHDLQHFEYMVFPPIFVWFCPNCKWKYEKSENVVCVPFREPPKEG